MDFYLLGEKIRDLRTLHRFSQADLAERIDVSTNYIGQIERGDRKPSLETLVSLCNALDTSMDYILSDSLTTNGDLVTRDITSKLQDLSLEEKTFIYNIIVSYSHMKNKRNDKKE